MIANNKNGRWTLNRTSGVLALILLAATSFGQIPSGSVTGTVKDEQGGVLPGVTVTLQGVDATRTFTSDEAGGYRFYNVAPGAYKVRLELPGFTMTIHENVVVEVGKNVDLPTVMKVASVLASVTVTETSPIVNTQK